MKNEHSIRLNFINAATAMHSTSEVADIALEAKKELQHRGYSVYPTYTGDKGGVVFDVLLGIASVIYNNKDLIIALSGVAAPIIAYLLKRRGSGDETSNNAMPDKIVFILDGHRYDIEARQSLQDESLLEQLLLAQISDLKQPINPNKVTIEVEIYDRPIKRRR